MITQRSCAPVNAVFASLLFQAFQQSYAEFATVSPRAGCGPYYVKAASGCYGNRSSKNSGRKEHQVVVINDALKVTAFL